MSFEFKKGTQLMKTFFREVLITLIIAVVIYLGLQLIIDSRGISSGSMEPTLQIGQRLIVSKLTYKFHEPKRGDIIVFHPPKEPENSTPFIKRIIGLPGETVEVQNNTVYINGQPLDEPYIKEPINYTMPAVKVPRNEYFVLGDNRNVSGDSHTGWTVPREDIIGKAWLTTWPPSAWGLVEAATYAK
jgi:signal peptidase I